MELGLTTFVETTPDVKTGKLIGHAERLREVLEEIILADEIGLDVFGVGEHHRQDYACSSPAVLLHITSPVRMSTASHLIGSAPGPDNTV